MNFLNDDVIKSVFAKMDTSGCRMKLLEWQVYDIMGRNHEGHTSDRARLLIRYVKKNDATIVHERSFFLKLKTNISRDELTEGMFRREYHVYAKIMPQMVRENFECSPRCYYCDDREHNLILEDLNGVGYERRAQYQLLDFNHAIVVLKELAKFHGHSVKIMETKPHTLDETRKGYPLAIALRSEPFAIYFEALFFETMSRFEPDFTRANCSSIKKCARNIMTVGSDELEKNISFGVLNHGDYRTENFMFKYDDGNKKNGPQAVRFIDYQLSFWADASVDIIYLFITSLQFDIFEKHFDQFLKIYTDTLEETLTRLGCVRRPITVDELRRNIYNKFRYWIMFVLAYLPALQYDSDDPLFIETDVFSIWGTRESDKLIDGKYCLPLFTKWLRYFVEKSLAGYPVFEATT